MSHSSTFSDQPLPSQVRTAAGRASRPALLLILSAAILLALGAAGALRIHQQRVWRANEMAFRAERVRVMTEPTGWLSLVGLDWLQAGENSVGTADGSRVRLSTSGAGAGAGRLATLVLADGKVSLQAPEGGFPAQLREDGGAPHDGPLAADDHPTTLTAGTLSMTVIERGDRRAVRTKDSKAPTLTGFHGLRWYAPDPKYVVTATWTPYQPAHLLRIPTVVGTTEEMPSPGVAEFTIDGQKLRLEPVLEEPGAKELFFILRDRTGRTMTDGAARFLYTGFPDHGLGQPGKLTLDLNHVRNPPCAYTPYATCPLPPPTNRLDVALPVGEQRYEP
jgi:uncharacterized protein (DUF1684 family)